MSSANFKPERTAATTLSVAKRFRCGEILYHHFIANVLLTVKLKEFPNLLSLFDVVVVKKLGGKFLDHSVYLLQTIMASGMVPPARVGHGSLFTDPTRSISTWTQPDQTHHKLKSETRPNRPDQ